MLHVDLREVARAAVETVGAVPAADPLFADIGVVLSEPVHVTGRVQAAGEGRFYWHGALRTTVAAECRRCLAPVAVPIRAAIGTLFSRDADVVADPDVYAVARDATALELGPVVREELILAVPQFVECREDCRGLCPQCGRDLNAGPCGCRPPTDERWAGLAGLRDKLSD